MSDPPYKDHTGKGGGTPPRNTSGTNHSNRDSIENSVESAIWNDKSLVNPSTLIDEERLVNKESQLDEIIIHLKQVLEGHQPPNLYLYGSSGTGKSLITHLVCKELENIASDYGREFNYVELNCQPVNTHSRAINKLIEGTAHRLNVDHDIPLQGIATDQKLTSFFQLVDDHCESFLIILDEIDLLLGYQDEPAHSKLLYQLSRADTLADNDCQISIVAITNRGRFLEEDVGSRALSTFNPNYIQFPDYTKAELEAILENRRDAFTQGTLKPDVIPAVAEFAARGHGDARIAIDLIREAGEVAHKRRTDRVTVEHVEAAKDTYEQRRILKQLTGQSPQKKLVLMSTAITAQALADAGRGVPAPATWKVYKLLAHEYGEAVKSESSFHRYLDELETNRLVDLETTSTGPTSGVYKRIDIENPDAVRNAIESSVDFTVKDELDRFAKERAKQASTHYRRDHSESTG